MKAMTVHNVVLSFDVDHLEGRTKEELAEKAIYEINEILENDTSALRASVIAYREDIDIDLTDDEEALV